MPEHVIARSSVQVPSTLDLSEISGTRGNALARGIQTIGLPSARVVTRL